MHTQLTAGPNAQKQVSGHVSFVTGIERLGMKLRSGKESDIQVVLLVLLQASGTVFSERKLNALKCNEMPEIMPENSDVFKSSMQSECCESPQGDCDMESKHCSSSDLQSLTCILQC